MMMTAGSSVFLDTNVLVYFTFPDPPWHAAAQTRLRELLRPGVSFWISRQILREFLSATTRPGALSPPPPLPVLTARVREFVSGFRMAEDDAAVTAQHLEILEQVGVQGKQVHDANIVATMRRHGIRYLLTHNTVDFARYSPWITVLPLVP